MDCQQASNDLNRLLDGELVGEERAAMEAHLAGCEACRGALAALRADDAELSRAFAPRRAAGNELAARVIDRLREQRQPRRRGWSWTAVPVSVAAGFLLAVLLFQPSPRRTPPEAAPIPLARLALATGRTELRAPQSRIWLGCPDEAAIEAGAAVRTTSAALCEIHANDGAQIRLDAGTLIELPTPRCVKLTQGELYSAVPVNGSAFKVELPDAVVETAAGKLDVACSPGKASLTVIEGSADLKCKSGTRRVAAGECVRLAAGCVEESAQVSDPLATTAWVNELLLRKDPADAELAQRLNALLARIGQEKLAYLHEEEIRKMGSRAAVPLLRYLQSSRPSQDDASRVTAARLAADLADSAAIGDFVALLADADPNVRFHAARALERLTGLNQGRATSDWQEELSSCQPTIEAWRQWWRLRAKK